MSYKFLRPALAEVREAVTFYESKAPGLGREFLTELRATIQRITTNPQAWTALTEEIRRCRLRRFPYGVIYTIEPDHILIVSVMHLHRHPKSWQQNL